MELDQMIFDDLINCYKTRNYQFDFVSEDLFIDKASKGVYIHFDAMNKEKFIAYMEKTTCFFDTHLPIQKDSFVELYMEFMDNYCSKKRNTRYAISLTKCATPPALG